MMYNGLFELHCIELDERIHLTRNGSSNVNNEGTTCFVFHSDF